MSVVVCALQLAAAAAAVGLMVAAAALGEIGQISRRPFCPLTATESIAKIRRTLRDVRARTFK